MLVKKILSKIISFITSYPAFKKQLKGYKGVEYPDSKYVVIKMSNSKIHGRYFYTLIKFFSLSGYSIYFPDLNWTYFRKNFHNNPHSDYYQLIFKEKLLVFNDPPIKAQGIVNICSKKLSPDYFSSIHLKENTSINSFHIPMAMHPLFYHNNYWNEDLDLLAKRKKSIFMSGSFDPTVYSGIKNTPFKIESRLEVFEYLKNKKLLKNIDPEEDLNDILNKSSDFSCIILDSRKTPIPMQDLRQSINQFSFYLALPGVIMPLCHNIVEALSVGTIPIIHINYAKLMTPELIHMHDAIIYEDLDELEYCINLAYNIDEETLKSMQKNVINYYNLNLTPSAVIQNITTNSYDVLYLQAEHLSVEILEKNLSFKKIVNTLKIITIALVLNLII
ncbi:hypothetical protein A9Q87_06990 [Flavobacteriales bacterium 34_180_T64]|nr:hypothetical protein A9Q87_06990 [Flavobacteriales bacterium 34_180_T64]